MEKASILQMAKGAFQERADHEMKRVIDNILDPNTKPNAKRKIVLSIEFIPDNSRQKISVSVSAKSTIAPAEPVETSLCIIGNEDGEMQVAEMVPQIPGQTFIDGTEQHAPKILKIANK